MRTLLTTLFSFATVTVASAQGTILIQNYLGDATTFLIGYGWAPLKGRNYSVEVFKFDPNAVSGFGIQLGSTMSLDANGRFSAGEVVVPDAPAGTTAQLIVRAWDNRSGITYVAAIAKNTSNPFTTGVLGGVGNPPMPALSMVTGLPSGFQGFIVDYLPEPPVTSLGCLGLAAFLVWRRR